MDVIPSFLAHSGTISSFLYHSVILSSFQYCFIIWMSFHHLNVIPSFECHSIIWISFYHSRFIPSIIVHVRNILSFGCHFIHSMVIRALEWRGMTFCWNDRNEVRMMISVIPDVRMMISFIPVIPNYRKKWGLPWFHSCHSDLIPSFGCHSKIQFQKEWCRNDRWFLEKVDHFPQWNIFYQYNIYQCWLNFNQYLLVTFWYISALKKKQCTVRVNRVQD